MVLMLCGLRLKYAKELIELFPWRGAAVREDRLPASHLGVAVAMTSVLMHSGELRSTTIT